MVVVNPIRQNPALGLKGKNILAMTYWVMAFLGSLADPENFARWLRITRGQRNTDVEAAPHGLWGAVVYVLPGSHRLQAGDRGGIAGAVALDDHGVRKFDNQFIRDLLCGVAADPAFGGATADDFSELEKILREEDHLRRATLTWGWFYLQVKFVLETANADVYGHARRQWDRLGWLISAGSGVRPVHEGCLTDAQEGVSEAMRRITSLSLGTVFFSGL